MRRIAIAIALTLGCGASPPPIVTPEPADVAPPSNPDPDGDGLIEAHDVCPCEAEDVDGFEDGDGCPELDNDRDRIVDACDLCPDEPETFNGRCDEDGCPDRSHICIEQSRIQIMEYVFFARRSSSLQPVSTPILEALAATLNGNPQLTLVALIGEADPHEPRRQGLALARAQAVLEAMVARGVIRERLVAEADPAPVHEPSEPPEQWRRVRFVIRTIDSQPYDESAPVDGGCGSPRACEVPVCTPPVPVHAC